jgi:hypothetical protein
MNTTPTTPTVSPYEAHKLVNQWLKDEGLTKVIPPQMMYNYTAGRITKGKTPYIPAHLGEDNKWKVDLEGLKSWYAKYAAKVRVLSTLA